MILFLLSILGCKETPRPPSWIKTKVLADREDHPSKILSDGSFVYYVTGGTVASQRAGTNNIKRISLKDGGVSVLVNMGERIPDTTLALDDKFLYWTDGGSILRVPKEGGQSETVVANTGAPAEMIVDDENIYWIIWTGEGSPPKPLMFASKQVGSEAKQLAPPQIGANGLCIDNDTVYWASPAGLKKAPKTGGEATIFYNDPTLNQPTTGLVQDAENFYYAQMDKKGNSSLMKLAKMGGAPRQIAPSINHTMEFVADELYVYYFDDEKGYGSFGPVALRKVSKQGGEPVTLDMGDAGWVKFIAVDKTQVYFTDISKVYALAK
jgi:hypothetical protein